MTASIGRVNVECIPEGLATTAAEQAVRGSGTHYVIAATAFVTQAIGNERWFEVHTSAGQFEDEIEFEAVTSHGVVLGSGRGKFKIVGGAATSSTTISGRIENLTGEEVRRVETVRARWTYGRK